MSESPPRRFTASELLKCVIREAALRRSTYPRLIGRGVMSAQTAERETAMMEEVVEIIRRLAKDESPTKELPFD